MGFSWGNVLNLWLLPYLNWKLCLSLLTESCPRRTWVQDTDCKCPSGYFGDYDTGCYDWWRSVRCHLNELIVQKNGPSYFRLVIVLILLNFGRFRKHRGESTDDKNKPKFGNINLNLMENRSWMEKVLLFSFICLKCYLLFYLLLNCFLFAWQVVRLHLLLTVKESAINIPTNLEARRRITFFTNSLFMIMPDAPKVRDMLSFRFGLQHIAIVFEGDILEFNYNRVILEFNSNMGCSINEDFILFLFSLLEVPFVGVKSWIWVSRAT